MDNERRKLLEEISLSKEIQKETKEAGITAIEVGKLKAQAKISEKNLATQKKQITTAIKDARTPLPIRTMERYERDFSRMKEKRAFKVTATLVLVAIIVSFFMQPSIFFIKSNNGLELINYSERKISNIKIYSFNEIVKGNNTPLLNFAEMPGKAFLPIEYPETTVFIAIADRQMPAIGTYIPNANINNGENNNSKTGKTLKETLEEDLGRDANAG